MKAAHWAAFILLRYQFENLFQFFIGDGTFFGLIVNGSKVNDGGSNFYISDNPCTTAFTFSF